MAWVKIDVEPTHVGMNRIPHPRHLPVASGAHARGDEPVVDAAEDQIEAWSPRTWG